MTKVSRKKHSREGKMIYDFWRSMTFLESKDEVRDFLKALLTPTEMLMFAKRIEVAKLLIGDCDYKFIKREVQVTNATISHIKNSLVSGAYYGFLKPLQRLENADAKIRNKRQKILERRDFTKTTLSQEIVKVAGKQAVRQYKKWQKFKTAAV